jgi:hypothetical protein
MDRWHGLTMEDIRAIEDKTKEELDQVSRPVGYLVGRKTTVHLHFGTSTILCFAYREGQKNCICFGWITFLRMMCIM